MLSEGSTESEFVVVVPDCFNLDVPLAGFRPPVPEPPTPSSESGDSHLINMTVSDFEPRSDASNHPEPDEFKLHSPAEEPESNDEPPAALGESHSPSLSPQPRQETNEFSPHPMTLDRVWKSGSRNPISYATGLLNTATNLFDTHVHFIPRGRAQSDPVNRNEDREEWQVEGFEGSIEEAVRNIKCSKKKHSREE